MGLSAWSRLLCFALTHSDMACWRLRRRIKHTQPVMSTSLSRRSENVATTKG
jgi:hypothetical protein